MTRFDWDLAKDRSNQRKHGISFTIAQHVLTTQTPCQSRTALKLVSAGGRRLASLTAYCYCWLPIPFTTMVKMK